MTRSRVNFYTFSLGLAYQGLWKSGLRLSQIVEDHAKPYVTDISGRRMNEDLSFAPEDGILQGNGVQRQSYQIRALARKTLSYQKRQVFVNVCCIALCPLMMVAISAIMGAVVAALIARSSNPTVYLACSSANASTAQGFPLSSNDTAGPLPYVNRSEVPNAPTGARDPEYVNLTNFYITSGTFSITESKEGCVWWFEHSYPFRMPYEIDPNVTESRYRRDTTFKPDPVGGWLGTAQLIFPFNLVTMQTFPWLYVLDAPGVNSGMRLEMDDIDLAGYEEMYLFSPSNSTFGYADFLFPNDTSTGLLGAMDVNFYVNITFNNQSSTGVADQFTALAHPTGISPGYSMSVSATGSLSSMSTGLSSSLPTGLSSSLPTGLSSSLPTGLSSSLPTGLSSSLPTGLSSSLTIPSSSTLPASSSSGLSFSSSSQNPSNTGTLSFTSTGSSQTSQPSFSTPSAPTTPTFPPTSQDSSSSTSDSETKTTTPVSGEASSSSSQTGPTAVLFSPPTNSSNTSSSSILHDFQLGSFKFVPFFVKANGTTQDVDDLLTSKIFQTIQQLSLVDKTALENDSASDVDLIAFYTSIAGIVTSMPWGALKFDLINPRNRLWNYTLQIGTDSRISAAASFPSRGKRLLAQQAQLSNAFLRTSNSSYENYTISHGYRIMPYVLSTAATIPIGSLVGRILYPFGVSFLLPIFVITLVKEKEDRILVMMKMNGLKTYSYYLAHYIHFYILHIISSAIFVIAGWAFRMELFTKTEPSVYIILIILWGTAQVTLAFFLACFFNKSRTALVVVFLIVLLGVIINLALEFLLTSKAPIAYFIWPAFAFYRALTAINTRSVSASQIPYRLSDLTGDDEVLSAVTALTIETFVFFILAWYLNMVLPSEYGVRRQWYFPIMDLWNRLKGQPNLPEEDSSGGRDVDPRETRFEDSDVKEERARVLADEYGRDDPIVVKRIRKVYGRRGKLAVKDVTFAVEQNMILGLLGPNGAGKTTLISILTGLYEPSSGYARLAGYNIMTHMKLVYMSIGVCPQHDILWDDLTVREHLLFYARLKGIPADQEGEAVQNSLKYVKLEPFEDRLSKGLSGGEKRRLSIAIALIGDPRVVFLDEPTTGLDPEVRRLIWNIINEAKAGRTIVLTTHSMEEAEVLSQRIAIMAKGTLRVIGNQLRLKELYGRGFKLSFTCRPENVERASKYIESQLPLTAKKLDSFVTNVSYEFMANPGLIPSLFREIGAHKYAYGIEDWGISQTTLEEVFLRIIGESDAEAD